MDNRGQAEPEPEGAPYVRMPWPVVAISLFAFLAVLFGVGLYANGYFRPAGAAATPVPAAAAPNTTAAPTPTPVAAVPTPGRTPLVLITIASPTPTEPPAAPTVAPTSPPAVSNTPLPLPTVEPTLAAEVATAYVTFWRVTSHALLELDSSHLGDVMDGDYLENVKKRIEELRLEGRAIKTQVVLNYAVVEANAGSASVVDDYTDNSVYVKIGTDEPLTAPMADELSVLYRLKRSSGTWKVIDSARSP